MPVRWEEAARDQASCEFYEEVVELSQLNVFRLTDGVKGYQRPLNENFVLKIMDKFDASEARTIFVSQRKDDSMWVLDGQHTAEILKRKGITHWKCRLFMGLTPAHEAHRFQQYQHNSQRLSPIVQWNAEVLAGDPVKVAIEKVLDKHKLRISDSDVRFKEGYIPVKLSGVLPKLYAFGGKDFGAEVVDAALALSLDAWGYERSSLSGRVLSGLGYLLVYSSLPIDRKRLIAALQNTTPAQIIQNAPGETGSGGAGRKYGLEIENLYLGQSPDYPFKLKRNGKETPRLPETASKSPTYTPHGPPFFQ